jgi:UDP-glucose 4-epimerase
MSILITGIAGFIGSNIAEAFIQRGLTVFGIDNLSLGRLENLAKIMDNPGFLFRKTEMTNLIEYQEAVAHLNSQEPITEVWHLAANSDIPAGVCDANVDLHNTFMTTYNTLEIMKAFNIKLLAFASSSAIYGNMGRQAIAEDMGPLLPISNYGAMKLASEAAICAATESHLHRSYIFRFPNVIGVPATHGVMLDFIHKLKATPENLSVLGNGTQQKEYLHVEELIDAMLFIRNYAEEKVAVFNIGTSDEGVTVRFIAEEIVRIVSPGATISYGEGNRGWIGDVPCFNYSIAKLIKLGWTPKLGSQDAVLKAIREIAAYEGTSCQ